MNNYYTHSRKNLLTLINPLPTSALDVGCASGNFGNLLKKNNVKEVWGVEPVPNAATMANTKLDKVINGVFDESVDFGNKKFDAIFFNDVLEHMEFPEKALSVTKKILADDGFVYASIPNFLLFNNVYSMIKTKDWKYTDSGTLDRTHLRFFTRKSIIRLFQKNNFELIQIDGINPTTNKKFIFLHNFFPKQLADFKYTQYCIKARKRKIGGRFNSNS